jgi:hypothetical protein
MTIYLWVAVVGLFALLARIHLTSERRRWPAYHKALAWGFALSSLALTVWRGLT